MVDYFFDGYAVIEIIKANPNYTKYIEEQIVFTIFNLTEIYWAVLRDFNEQKADEIYSEIKSFVIDITDDVLKDAVKFRHKHKKRELSYADCIGYVYALKNNLIFLTGDKEFQSLPNVEFISK